MLKNVETCFVLAVERFMLYFSHLTSAGSIDHWDCFPRENCYNRYAKENDGTADDGKPATRDTIWCLSVVASLAADRGLGFRAHYTACTVDAGSCWW